MKSSLKLGQIAGIGVFVHWSFFLLLAWIIYMGIAAGETAAVVIGGVGFILALFGCIVLHELGHALMARRFHVQTRDITLLPIGGVARLERIPRDPTQELLIAVAGPAVNVVIAIVLAAVIVLFGHVDQLGTTRLLTGQFLARLMWVNLGLVLFNLIPAFPMDGGRVLRALLARRLTYFQATRSAVTIGKIIAGFFAIAGLFYNPILILIAVFVYFGGQGEVQLARLRELVEGMKVGEVMITSFRTVSADAPLGSVIDQMTNRWQHDFPVVNEAGETIGLLLSRDINRALKATGELTTARQWMQSSYEVIDAEAPLEQSLHKLLSGAAPVLPVFRNGKMVGLLTSQHLKQLLGARLSQHGDHLRHDFSHSMCVPARSPISTVHHV